ncbi:MAG: polyprenol monophosphomannose synthase [Vulcanimicrobiota bacterium]
MVSIVIPTYNEREGIEKVIERISKTLHFARKEYEIIVVDDNSPDGTWHLCQELTEKFPLRVLRRTDKKGLSSAVIDGWKIARGDILGVMDADGSHDEKILPHMIEEIEEGKIDLAIGSRYVPGGGTKDWPWFREFTSKTAIKFARPVTKLKDATSGYCVFRRNIIEDVELDPIGWKIVLEVQVKGNYKKYEEFPIVFKDREKGKSKLSQGAIINYLQHIWKLMQWMKKHNRKPR